jgi:hypothetical protein
MIKSLISGKGKGFFQTSSGADLDLCSLGIGILFPGLKWLGCVADHSPPYSLRLRTSGSLPTGPFASVVCKE